MTWVPVCSAENTPYMAWQARLFTFSALTRLGIAPVVVVHDRGRRQLQRDLAIAAEAGARIVRASSYRGPRDYAPRNTAGTLLEAARVLRGEADRVLLCDPDMIFARAPELPHALSGDRYSYVFAGSTGAMFRALAPRVGVELEALDAALPVVQLGVPHVVPLDLAEAFGNEWIAVMDALTPAEWRPEFYTLSMHAFGIAALRLGIRPVVTEVCQLNHVQLAHLARPVVHYCYGDSLWNKRTWIGRTDGVWTPPVAPWGTVLGEVCAQLAGAASAALTPAH